MAFEPRLPRPIVPFDVRDWVSAYDLGTERAIVQAPADEWSLIALRLCAADDARLMGALTVTVNDYARLVIPLVALNNGEWFQPKITLLFNKRDTLAVRSDTPITLALRGLYKLPEPKKEAP